MGSEEFVHRPGGVLTHVVEHVGVAPQGHGGVRVTEHFGDGVERNTLPKRQRSGGVPEIVKAHPGRESSFFQEAS